MNLGATYGVRRRRWSTRAVRGQQVDGGQYNQNPFFCPTDVGVQELSLLRAGLHGRWPSPAAFDLYPGNRPRRSSSTTASTARDDLTLVRGNHQFGVGGKRPILGRELPRPRRAPTVHGASPARTRAGAGRHAGGRSPAVEHGRCQPGDRRTTRTSARMRRIRGALSSRVTINAGAAVGAVLRPEPREQRRSRSSSGELRPGHHERAVPAGAGRPALSGGRRVPAAARRGCTSSGGTCRRARAWRGTCTGMAAWRCAPRIRWAMTSWRASTTTSTAAPRRSATARP